MADQKPLVGKLNQISGQLSSHWGRITDDEVHKLNQKRAILVGKLQKKYGHRQRNTPPTE